MDSAVTLLPEPDSPTMASVSPAATSNETLIDRGDRAAVGAEAGRQVADLQKGFCHVDRPGRRGIRRRLWT